MKVVKALLVAVLLTVMAAGPAPAGDLHFGTMDGKMWEIDDISIGIDDGTVFLEHEYEDEWIEITEDYELFVNGDRVKTDEEQQEMVVEFYDGVIEIKDMAIDVGIEGARIGLAGAGIGLKAVGGVFKMIFTDYDEDDLDRDLERAASKLEAKARPNRSVGKIIRYVRVSA